MEDAYRHIMEDRREQYQMLATILPLARSPWSKEDSRAISDHAKRLEKILEAMTPWRSKRYQGGYGGKIKPGTVVVIADAQEMDLEIFKDAEIISEG